MNQEWAEMEKGKKGRTGRGGPWSWVSVMTRLGSKLRSSESGRPMGALPSIALVITYKPEDIPDIVTVMSMQVLKG